MPERVLAQVESEQIVEQAILVGHLSNEVLNLISRGGLPSLYMSEIFTITDIVAGSKAVGDVSLGKTVVLAGININTAFDGGVTMTLGDASAQGRFLAASDVKSDLLGGRFLTIPCHTYDIDTEVSIYFPTGSPTVGQGSVFLVYV